MKNVLFITWDGPQTFYMEGLFMPIFEEISKKMAIEFHVIQFTWGDDERTAITKRAAEKRGIIYHAFPIKRKPVVSIGSLYTLLTSSKAIKKYINDCSIDVVMPRSTFPAFMVDQINVKRFQLIFDADGLPVEEKVEFDGLKKGGFQYNWMKSTEKKIINNADVVITRSNKAVDILLDGRNDSLRNKFVVVSNGRDSNDFKFDETKRKNIRKKYNIPDDALLLIYVGSLGEKYALKEMMAIFEIISQKKEVYFFIITGDLLYLEKMFPNYDKKKTIVKRVNADEVSQYISAADIGFALIYPTYSMRAAVPTKLGEYLLCGLPVIASVGIGDTEEILENFPNCLLYHHDILLSNQLSSILGFIENERGLEREITRAKAMTYFSLEAAAKSYIRAIKKLT